MSGTLNESSSTPLYAQLVAELKAKMQDGTYAVGERIPSEAELDEQYGVSRITVRRAIKELVAEGLLTKKQGKGTFVNAPAAASLCKFTQDNEVKGFTVACADNGVTPGARVVACGVVDGLDRERDFFGFGGEGRLLYIERVRTADNIPIMVERNWFPYDRYAFFEQSDLTDASLFDLIRTVRATEASLREPCTLNVERATPELAASLDVPCDEPLFLYVGRYYDDDGLPMYLGEQHIVGTRYTFRI